MDDDWDHPKQLIWDVVPHPSKYSTCLSFVCSSGSQISETWALKVTYFPEGDDSDIPVYIQDLNGKCYQVRLQEKTSEEKMEKTVTAKNLSRGSWIYGRCKIVLGHALVIGWWWSFILCCNRHEWYFGVQVQSLNTIWVAWGKSLVSPPSIKKLNKNVGTNNYL